MARLPLALRFLLILLIPGMITGCWDRKEMDELALVMASGIDLTEDGQLEITVQIALPTGIPSAVQSGGPDKKPIIVLSSKGKNSSDILGKLQQQMSRTIHFGHRSVIVFGEQYARKGVNQVLDTFTRLPESRYNSYVLTARGATAKEVLSTPYQPELISGIGMAKIQSNNISFGVKIDQYASALATQGRSAITGGIRVMGQEPSNKTFVIDQIAMYRGNKLVGFLEGERAKLLRWWSEQKYKIRFTVRVEPESQRYKGIIGVELVDSKKKIHMKIHNGMPEFLIDLNATVRAVDNDSSLDVTQEENMRKVELLLSTQITEDMDELLQYVKNELKSDILGLGEIVHHRRPYVWKKLRSSWVDIYPTIPVQVVSKIKIVRTGKTEKPAHTGSAN
ncbi:Ger(x)C family spore germination protein [Paenibacillus massiliensis]|uniref:Ger(x)C family spore germination protein n=1 Tax=Paenibacillus massiliensis TaxID=225917 RepID=UPI0004032183|nr:Ger(x)C family spore germination protein [Paenibacillus massiliensis]